MICFHRSYYFQKKPFFQKNPENRKTGYNIRAEKLTDVGNICDFYLDGKSSENAADLDSLVEPSIYLKVNQ